MKRQFSACRTPRSMYPSIFNSFPVIGTASAKNRRFHVPQPTFLFPLETPLRLSRNVLHGWKDNSMLVKRLAACTYLSWILSELYDAITLNVVWMEREFDAYKLSCCMCESNYIRYWDTARYWSKIVNFFIPLAFDAPVRGVPVGIAPPRFVRKN